MRRAIAVAPFVCPQCRTQGLLPREEEVESTTSPRLAEWHAACPRCSSSLPLALRVLHCWVRCPVCQLHFVASQSVTWAPTTTIPYSPPLFPSPNWTLIGGLLLGGGIWAILNVGLAVLASFFICCLWPGVYLALIWGIRAIVHGSQMLSSGYQGQGPSPRLLAILQILLIINLDVVNFILGIINLAHLKK